MAVQIVFNDNLNPATANLSSRFINGSAFYLSAPLIDSELEIDVFLQIYIPTLDGETVRVIPLSKVEEQAILLNRSNTETMMVIPYEFVDTNLEMALLFLASSNTYLQATVISKNCNLTTICSDINNNQARLERIEQTLNEIIPI